PEPCQAAYIHGWKFHDQQQLLRPVFPASTGRQYTFSPTERPIVHGSCEPVRSSGDGLVLDTIISRRGPRWLARSVSERGPGARLKRPGYRRTHEAISPIRFANGRANISGATEIFAPVRAVEGVSQFRSSVSERHTAFRGCEHGVGLRL